VKTMSALTSVWDLIVSNILTPIFLIIGTAVVTIVGTYVKKITNSIVSKNTAESLAAAITAKNELLNSLSTIVDAAVATNMSLANTMKESNNGRLSDDQIKELNDSAKEMIEKALPASIMDEDSTLLQLIGGKDQLDTIIMGLMEKHVIGEKKNINSVG
jgi:hypothetical protein